jgi:UDP-N-acetylmuramate dehydrogenase
MNAGAHGGQMADVLVDVEIFRLEEGRVERVHAAQAGFSYRHSELPSDAVVTGAEFELRSGDPVSIRTAMDEARAWRRRTQPLAEPNCGSVFKNPVDGHAAALIEQAGLKGTRVGSVQVSTKHANFIVADEGGHAEDVFALIDLVRRTVESRTGVVLEPEVRLIGGFDRVGG